MTARSRLMSAFYSVFPFAIVIGLWQVGAFIVGPSRFPDIPQTITALFGSIFAEPIIEAQGGGANGFIPHIAATIMGYSSGLACGTGIGFLVALIMSQLKVVSHLLEPCLEFFRALPPLLVIPFVILLCRSNDSLEIFCVAIYSAFSICVYTLNAIKNVKPNYIYLARLLGAGWMRSVFDVQVPAIMPELLGAFRVTAPLSLGIAVVVEYMAAPQGIGRVMKFAISYSRIDLIMASVIWVVLIAITTDLLISIVFRNVIRWARREQLGLS